MWRAFGVAHVAWVANILDGEVMALAERLAAIGITAAIVARFVDRFECRDAATCFAPTNFLVAYEATRVIEEQSVFASAAKGTHERRVVVKIGEMLCLKRDMPCKPCAGVGQIGVDGAFWIYRTAET